MEKKEFLNAIKKLRTDAKKRKFNQTFDFIVNLKNLDLKKPDNKVDLFLVLPHGIGKKRKLCAFVDGSLVTAAKKVFDKVLEEREFKIIGKNKREARKLASQYNFFVAQANLMPQVASAFGKILGPKGKMPNPKGGCVIPPKILNLEPIVKKLQKTIRIMTKNELSVKCPVGNESMTDEEVAENLAYVYTNLEHSLSQGKNNVRAVFLKLTMGSPVKVGESDE
ncbi:MAG: 50S ribosomal protein L1 [Candidatus Woesearchaeota archaeon]